MNRRIKKKKAKQLAQKKQIELENKLRKLSQEEIEAITKMINQAAVSYTHLTLPTILLV